MTVLLARNRQPLPTVAAGVPHANLAAELVTLPSELLAVVCEATVELKVRLGHAGVREAARGPTRSRGAPRLSQYQRSPLAVIRAYAEYYWWYH